MSSQTDDYLTQLQNAGAANPSAAKALGKPTPADSVLNGGDPGTDQMWKQYQQDVAAKKQAMQAPIQQMNKVIDTPKPAIPDQKQVGAAPKAQDYKTEQAWIGALTALSAIVGSRGRARGTGALNAFAAGMKGIQAGNQQAFENAYKTWDEETKGVIENNKILQDKYKAVLDDRALSLSEQEQKAKMIAYENDDKIGMDAKGIDIHARMYDMRQKAIEKLEERTQAVKDKKEAHDQAQLEKNEPHIDEDTARHIAGRFMLDKTALSGTLGYGDSPDKVYVQKILGEMQKELNLTDGDVVAMQMGTKASAAALSSITTKYASIKSFEDTALTNMKLAESLMYKGAGTEAGPIINRWLQAGRKATGDEDVKAFDGAIRAVGNEVAKINSGATGSAAATEGAVSRVDDTINGMDSPRAITKIFHDVWVPEMKNRTESLENIMAAARGNIATGGKTPIGGTEPTGAGAPAGGIPVAGSTVHWDDWK